MTGPLSVFEVDRTDFGTTRVSSAVVPDLAAGQVLLAVDRFALTSNNITYAVSGDLLDYWGFFPTEAPWGRIPAMGFASVAASRHAEIAEGGTYFGFYPMATHLVIDAEVRSGGFVDRAEHRSKHAAAYRTYQEQGEGQHEGDRGDRSLLLRGLFLTSFLVDDYLDDNDFFGAEAVLVTSASSKTAIALAHRLHVRRGPAAIGVTSSSNREFVAGLGLYDAVITYDETSAVDTFRPSVIVDIAGSTEVLGALHRGLGDSLRFSSQVGATHWEEFGGADDLPGPTPTFFFAPGQITKRTSEWGADEFASRTTAALDDFIDDSRRWLEVERGGGPDAVEGAYRGLLDGSARPDRGHILSMSPERFKR